MPEQPDLPARVPGHARSAAARPPGSPCPVDGGGRLDAVPAAAGSIVLDDVPGPDPEAFHGSAAAPVSIRDRLPERPGLARPHPSDAVQQSQRLEALGQLTAALAHEFNNLLTIVLANLERLAEEPDPGRRAGQVARADWGAQRAARLTTQLLSFARRRFDDARVVDVNDTVRDCDAILDQVAGHQLSVVLELADGALPVRLDPAGLELVLLNLVRNAADASAPGQRIVVRSRRCRSGDAEAVAVAVIDHGTGMTDQVKVQATQPFFTTKQPGRGTGLGLPMVKDFAEQCGGTVEISSAPGRGTTIDLVLPMAPGDGCPVRPSV